MILNDYPLAVALLFILGGGMFLVVLVWSILLFRRRQQKKRHGGYDNIVPTTVLEAFSHAEEQIGAPLYVVVGNAQQAVTIQRVYQRINVEPSEALLTSALAMLAIEGGVFPRMDVGEDVRNQWDDPLQDLDRAAHIACAVPIPQFGQSHDQWAYLIAKTDHLPASMDLIPHFSAIVDDWTQTRVRERIATQALHALLHLYRTERYGHASSSQTSGAQTVPATQGHKETATHNGPPAFPKPDASTRIPMQEGVSAPRTMTRTAFEARQHVPSHARESTASDAPSESDHARNDLATQAWMSFLARQWRAEYPIDDPRCFDANDNERIAQLCDQYGPTLIVGAVGVGKEFLARAVHERRTHGAARVVPLDCACMVESAVEMELFGFEGAPGILDAIANGTLILQSPTTISRELLFAIIGRCKEQHTQLTFIVRQPSAEKPSMATGAARLLREEVGDHVVYVPSLRERPTRIRPLAQVILDALSERYDDGILRTLSPDAERALQRFDYPANMWDLRALLRAACLRTDHDIIDASDLFVAISHEQSTAEQQHARDSERRDLLALLQRADGDKSEGARLLGVSRDTFVRKLRRHGLI